MPGSGLPLTDVFSTCVKRPDPGDAQATRVYVNAHFVEEWRDLAALSEIYTVERAPLDVPVTDRPPVPVRAVRVLAGEGLRGIGRRLRLRAIDAGERRISAAVAHLVAWRVRRREPIKNALRKGRCPDCGTPLRRARVCRRCEAIFYSPVIRDDND